MLSSKEPTFPIIRKKEIIEKANGFLAAELNKNHASTIISKNALTALQLQECTERIILLATKLDSLNKEVKLKNTAIEHLTNSVSWKITQPLRALRRLFVDPVGRQLKRPESTSLSSPNLIESFYHIDSPKQWIKNSQDTVVRGWCILKDGQVISGIRARLGSRIYLGSYGVDRPDLQAHFPNYIHSTKSGFKIEISLTTKDSEIDFEVFTQNGQWQSFLKQSLLNDEETAAKGSYPHWVKTQDTYTDTELNLISEVSKKLPYKPLISVLMPVYNTDLRWLKQAIDSVKNQTYDNWELCIADDNSTKGDICTYLNTCMQQDSRIKVIYRKENGHISQASNSALSLAQGEYICLLDHDDTLSSIALSSIALELNKNPNVALIYTDEDKIDENGIRFDPHFKPDWNPDLLSTQNYISHLSVYKTSLIKEIGGFRSNFEGSQDWDLILRTTELLKPNEIKHIHRVLYHWRASEGSTSLHLSEKNYALIAAKRALQEHFSRCKISINLITLPEGHFRPIYSIPDPAPLVSIIIPTKNAENLVRTCITSIVAKTDYTNYEIILIDNNSDDLSAIAYFNELKQDGIRVLPYKHPFNYSAITNFGAENAHGEILCLLNNDIEVLKSNWLDELVSHAIRSDIGAVGARLYYPNMSVQHAGVITGLGGVAGHAFKNFDKTNPGTPQFRLHRIQNLSAVTAACLAVRKKVFQEAKGFNKSLGVAFNDVDFCLKVKSLGYRNLYTPYAELVHHESATRGQENTPEKIKRFQKEIAYITKSWGESLLYDPAYNMNFSLDSEDFSYAYPPRIKRLQDEIKYWIDSKS